MYALPTVGNHEHQPGNTTLRLPVLADLEHSNRPEM
jgi:hypothetical protein